MHNHRYVIRCFDRVEEVILKRSVEGVGQFRNVVLVGDNVLCHEWPSVNRRNIVEYLSGDQLHHHRCVVGKLYALHRLQNETAVVLTRGNRTVVDVHTADVGAIVPVRDRVEVCGRRALLDEAATGY